MDLHWILLLVGFCFVNTVQPRSIAVSHRSIVREDGENLQRLDSLTIGNKQNRHNSKGGSLLYNLHELLQPLRTAGSEPEGAGYRVGGIKQKSPQQQLYQELFYGLQYVDTSSLGGGAAAETDPHLWGSILHQARHPNGL